MSGYKKCINTDKARQRKYTTKREEKERERERMRETDR